MNHEKHIFLSYRSIEADFALQLVADLKNSGFKIWMDRLATGIKDADDWRLSIEQALTKDTCVAVVVVLSPDYVNSNYCRNELARADRLKIPIYPIVLRQVPDDQWPLEIERLQYINFQDWRDEQIYKNKLIRLLKTLEKMFPNQLSVLPDPEIRYLNSFIADIEQKRGVLEYIELTMLRDSQMDVRPMPRPEDELGFALLLPVPFDREDKIMPYKSIAEAIVKNLRFVLLGAPGSGKTTAIRRLALDAAQQRLENLKNTPLPLLINLAQWTNDQSFMDFLQTKWPFSVDLGPLLSLGEVVLYIDGLNEMGASGAYKAQLIRDWINSPVSAKNFIITCRKDAYQDDIKLSDLPKVLALKMNEAQIEQFTKNYLNKNDVADFLPKVLPRIKENSQYDRTLLKLASIPYFLSALIYLYQNSPTHDLPHNSGNLFQRLSKALWDRERQRCTPGWIPFNQAEIAFSKLAFDMIEEGKSVEVPLDYAVEKIGSIELLYIGANANYIKIKQNKVSFYHQLMQEYFAAVELLKKNFSDKLTEPHFGVDMHGRLETVWDQVIISMCGLTLDPDSVIQEITVKDPFLSAACVNSGISVPDELYRKITTKLTEHIRSRNRSARREAVIALGDVGHESAIPGLMEAIYNFRIDPGSLIGGLASSSLSKIGKPAIPFLLNALNANVAIVQTLAVNSLSLMGQMAVDGLIKFLYGGKSISGQLYAADGLFVIATSESRFAAIDWWTKKGLNHENAYVRQHAVDMLGRHTKATPVIKKLENALSDNAITRTTDGGNKRVCDVATEALENIGTPEALKVIENWKRKDNGNNP